MTGYIRKLLNKLQHFMKKNPQYTPFPVAPYKPPKKGQRQYAPQPDTSTKLDASETTYVYSIDSRLSPLLCTSYRQYYSPGSQYNFEKSSKSYCPNEITM